MTRPSNDRSDTESSAQAPLEDAVLVARAQRGGPAGQRAFSTLVERYNGWLVGLLTSLLGRRCDAEDLAQEAFIRAFLALDRFRPQESLQAWLRTIATRLAYNRMRNHATRSRYTSAFADEPQDQWGDDGDGVAARELLSQTMEKLAYPQREILILHHVEELSVKETAQTLQIGLSAAKMRLSRARAEFVALYNQELDTDD